MLHFGSKFEENASVCYKIVIFFSIFKFISVPVHRFLQHFEMTFLHCIYEGAMARFSVFVHYHLWLTFIFFIIYI